MMDAHERWQEEIPEYLASRLDLERRRAFEAHLLECSACADRIDAWRPVIDGMRAGGEAVFEAHPEAMALREHARGRVPTDDHLRRHLAICPACDLQVTVWRIRENRPAAAIDPSRAGRGSPARRWLPAMTAAAGLLLGLVLSPRVGIGRRPKAVDSPPETPPAAAVPGGPAPLLILPAPLRGESIAPSFRVPAGSSIVVVAIRPVVPAAAAPEDLFHIALHDRGGAPVWSVTMRAADMRQHLRANEVIALVLPATALAPGSYRFSVRPDREPAGAPHWRVSFDIVP